MRKIMISYVLLALLGISLFVGGLKLLDLIESTKVSPYTHVQFHFLNSLGIAAIVYFVIFLPLSFLYRKLPHHFFFDVLNMALFVYICIQLGGYIFYITYPEWVELSGTNVRKETALIIFGFIGLIYATALSVLKNKKYI